LTGQRSLVRIQYDPPVLGDFIPGNRAQDTGLLLTLLMTGKGNLYFGYLKPNIVQSRDIPFIVKKQLCKENGLRTKIM
ncbi:MAG: hypothetical protein AAGA86_14615, partial [Bacteroidota bacterium]